MADPDRLTDQLASLKADNARLRRLLDEAGMPDGLRHALRDTVAMLRTIMRRTADTRRDVEDYAAHLEGRLDAIVRVRARTDAFGEADLQTLIADELAFHLVHEGDRAVLAGPVVSLRPKAAQLFALAVHELTTNAVEHGILASSPGRVRVSWQIEPGEGSQTLVLNWKELGAEALADRKAPGFGTMVLEETLFYELGTRAVATNEPDGMRWVLGTPLSAKLGRVTDVQTPSEWPL